jgi:predicted nucleic acid-binding protein
VRYALDTNIILYAEGMNDGLRQEIADRLIAAVGVPQLLVPLQAIGEAITALMRKRKLSAHRAAAMIAPWFHGARTQETTRKVIEGAIELATLHKFQFWDAVIVSAAVEGQADVLFSEDMQDGFNWRGTVILNPFASKPDFIVQTLLTHKLS